ncbi:MAG TPA: DUF559 domain-containing protein [Phenylobacterium sp.]|uniref:endonuclease domain-containing protein n=1 Tax=Phenylobacterium sp. TaxID=1871053 RepID=UPI002B590B77|nr:DUF559 domain-containing protein [Phenylobacterium sp.]HSV02447.1 DUF559 domain-containing protein [Phenylobacterium sp.]
MEKTLKRARRLRKEMSLPEVLLWKRLRGREAGKPVFRRQHPIGPYVLDFFCASARLCIEVDGGSHGFGQRPQGDRRRDIFLIDQGICTVRVAAREVLRDPEAVAGYLLNLAGSASPSTTSRSPSPARLAGEVL